LSFIAWMTAAANLLTCWVEAGPAAPLIQANEVTHVVFRNPRRVRSIWKTKIALFEKDRPSIAAKHRVAQAGLETVPSRASACR